MIKAQRAVVEMRGRQLRIHGAHTSGRLRLQTDYASHECRNYFFEQCKKAGIDVRKQSEVNNSSVNAASPKIADHHVSRSDRAYGFSSGGRNSSSSPYSRSYTNDLNCASPSGSTGAGAGLSYVSDGHTDLRESLNRSKQQRSRMLGGSGAEGRSPSRNSGRYGAGYGLRTSPVSSGDEKETTTAPSSSSSSKVKGEERAADAVRKRMVNSSGGRALTQLTVKTTDIDVASGEQRPSSRSGHYSKQSGRPAYRSSSNDSARGSQSPSLRNAGKAAAQGQQEQGDPQEDNSRPGTPVLDEKPDVVGFESTSSSAGMLRLSSQLRNSTSSSSSEPMSLPLPRFAFQGTSPSGTAAAATPTGSTPSTAAATPSPKAPSAKPSSLHLPKADPRLKSPTTPVCLKSPPLAGLRHGSAHLSGAPPTIAINASASDRPQDPRLGLLQVASSARKPPAAVPNSAAATAVSESEDDAAEAKAPAGSRKTEETSSTSDSKDSCGDPTSLSISDRVKALFAKCDRLNTPSVTGGGAGSVSSGIGSVSTPSTAGTTGSLSPAAYSATPTSAGTSSRFNLDLKPSAKPSEIVQKLLSRRSIIDEDSKRLEAAAGGSTAAEGATGKVEEKPDGVGEEDQDAAASLRKGPASGLTVQTGFNGGYNTISTLSDKAPSLPKTSTDLTAFKSSSSAISPPELSSSSLPATTAVSTSSTSFSSTTTTSIASSSASTSSFTSAAATKAPPTRTPLPLSQTIESLASASSLSSSSQQTSVAATASASYTSAARNGKAAAANTAEGPHHPQQQQQ